MNYLVIEGYKDAAESFALECGLKPNIDLESINDRMKIRTALQDGDVDSAMQQVNDLNVDILDSQPALLFQLQRQKLIELIRQGKVSEAIEFAQEELAPKGEEHVRFFPTPTTNRAKARVSTRAGEDHGIISFYTRYPRFLTIGFAFRHGSTTKDGRRAECRHSHVTTARQGSKATSLVEVDVVGTKFARRKGSFSENVVGWSNAGRIAS
jgi:hypothetical protein